MPGLPRMQEGGPSPSDVEEDEEWSEDSSEQDEEEEGEEEESSSISRGRRQHGLQQQQPAPKRRRLVTRLFDGDKQQEQQQQRQQAEDPDLLDEEDEAPAHSSRKRCADSAGEPAPEQGTSEGEGLEEQGEEDQAEGRAGTDPDSSDSGEGSPHGCRLSLALAAPVVHAVQCTRGHGLAACMHVGLPNPCVKHPPATPRTLMSQHARAHCLPACPPNMQMPVAPRRGAPAAHGCDPA